MTTCVVQQSTIASKIDYRHKLLRATTFDSSLISANMTSRKRHLSEANECHDSSMKTTKDDIDTNKRMKKGNYIRLNFQAFITCCFFSNMTLAYFFCTYIASSI